MPVSGDLAVSLETRPEGFIAAPNGMVGVMSPSGLIAKEGENSEARGQSCDVVLDRESFDVGEWEGFCLKAERGRLAEC